LSFLAKKFKPLKKPLFIILTLFFAVSAYSQRISTADLKQLQQKEDTLKALAKNLIIDSLTEGRMRNDSVFIRTLVRTLQVKNSFHYPFDSVRGISKLYSPDSTFRIFTWSLAFDDYYSRQRGAIQLRTDDGSLRLIPLTDFSEFTDKPNDSIRTKDNWIGAVYYNIIHNKHNGKNYYTLFGIDHHSVRSTKKWIEVLTFNERNQPVFGGPFFSFENDTGAMKKKVLHRYNIEYNKEASTLVNFVDDEGMILIDHLISETDEPDKPYTFIPDGDYQGFRWKNGKWIHVDKVFDFKLKDGEFPMPDPLHGDDGNVNDEKLKKPADSKPKKKTGKGS
jgi:hypothetical protein